MPPALTPAPTPDPTPAGAPSRRRLLAGAVAGSGALTTVLPTVLPTAAHGAGRRYAPGRYRGKGSGHVLSPADRHLVNRFSYGVTPALAREVRRAGGARAWFHRQLVPESVSDAGVPDFSRWFPGLSRGPAELWQRQERQEEGVWEVMEDYARWVLLRRMHSRRQVLEVMTEFWENHLHVPVNGDAAGLFRRSYGDTVRRHALGRFDQMLQATTTHPAMLVFLDNAVSTARSPNENLGRELLELHTVGRGVFGEDDVKASARILTGHRVDVWRTWVASYSPADHWRGPVRVLGFSHPNAAADGREATAAYLRYLAHHPATAQRIARKLAVKFVRDAPSQALVDHLARVYLANDTAITPVLRALVDSAEFRASAGTKVRDPGEDLVATYRVLRVGISAPPPGPAGEQHAAHTMLWQAAGLGTTPFGWTRPDGQPLDSQSWSSPSRLLASMSVHYSMSGGWWPRTGIRYRTPKQWMPGRRIRFDLLVDHLCMELLGRRSTATLLQACCQAVGVRPREKITRDHGLYRWNFHRLLSTLLDSPDHMTR